MNKITKLLTALACCVALLHSCSPEKKLQRKKDEAVNTVLADRKLIDRVGEEFLKLHESNDLLFDADDSTGLFPKYQNAMDTLRQQMLIDSLVNYYENQKKQATAQRPTSIDLRTFKPTVRNCEEEITAAYKRGYNEAYNQASQIKIPVFPDPEELRRLKAGYSFYRDGFNEKKDSLNSFYQYQISVQQNQSNFWYTLKLTGKNLITEWWFWLLTVFAIAYLMLRRNISSLFPLFKKKL